MDGDTVTLTRDEYEDLVDARDHAVAMRDVATGAMETLSDPDLDAYLAASAPVAFWRQRRGVTRAELAARAGIAETQLAEIEAGTPGGDVQLYARLSKALLVRIEDLLPPE